MSSRLSTLLLICMTVFLSSACSTTGTVKIPREERLRLYQLKSAELADISGWSIEGRLAISNEKEGGSGQFRWSKAETESRMDFHGAMGRGAWELEAGDWGAELVLADGEIHRAASIDELVRQNVGWQVPVESMSWWVRGLSVPGPFKRRDLDEKGDISLLQQDGWTVVYDRYQSVSGKSLPARLTATKKDWKVKLAIRDWNLLQQAESLD